MTTVTGGLFHWSTTPTLMNSLQHVYYICSLNFMRLLLVTVVLLVPNTISGIIFGRLAWLLKILLVCIMVTVYLGSLLYANVLNDFR